MNILKTATWALIIGTFTSCAVINKSMVNKNLAGSDYFNNHFTGFSLYDPISQEYLYQWNDDRYFNLASNTKLLTLYAGLKILGDSIPGLRYEITNDTLYFSGTGDPTFLYAPFKTQRTFDFLKDTSKVLVYVKSNFNDTKQAPGWTWEDYQYYYQPERSAFPIYGNTVSFPFDTVKQAFSVYPTFFTHFTELFNEPQSIPQRIESANIFAFAPDTTRSNYKNRVPFNTSDELVVRLLEDTLNRKIQIAEDFTFKYSDIMYSIPSYDLYAYMLKISDNLSAEQIQYLCATELGFELNSGFVRSHVLTNYFNTFPLLPKWRDGSGLSRYNLATPSFMIELLKKINNEIPINTMKVMFSIGGVDGTLRNWYKPLPGEPPYVFGKTGTLSNNHNLTGIIHTKSGRDLFFSFMNNNYPTSSTPVKAEMEQVMRLIYERF